MLIIVGLAVLTNWRTATRMLVGWDVAIVLYLGLVTHLMSVCDTHRIRERAAREDEGQLTMLVLTVAAALASLGAIVIELSSSGAARRGPAHILLATLTILLSWAFIHAMFALHYAHEFYDETEGGGMAFPGGDAAPDYWDFVYNAALLALTVNIAASAI